jgi:DNA-binding LacI/PurR family transcriptional regulator
MSVTIKDIAREANISYSTVSRALTGHPQVNDETRNKILKLASEMGYTPNALAKGLVSKNTDTIDLIIMVVMIMPIMDNNPYFRDIIYNKARQIRFIRSDSNLDSAGNSNTFQAVVVVF